MAKKPTLPVLQKVTVLKPFRYQTRRLEAGDEIEVPKAKANAFIFTKLAEPSTSRKAGRIAAPSPALKQKAAKKEPVSQDEPSAEDASEALTAARAEYFEKLGKKPYWGWSEAELREKMAEDE